MTDDMDAVEETGVAVVGGAARPSPVGPGARARGKARTVTHEPGAHQPGAVANEVPVTASTRGTARPRTGRSAPMWVAVTLGTVSVVTVVMALVFGLSWSNLQSQQDAANDAKSAASSFLLALTNFRPNTVDSDFSSILNMATGDFAKQAQSFFGSNIRQALEQARAESDGQIRNIYVQKVDGNQAVVYGVVDQTYANATAAAPATDVLRVEVDLTHTTQGWRISTVSVLTGPTVPGATSSTPGG
ncbi:MAG TPA: hypothetical protein VEI83_03430 [Acidimicrobiales bacterium]|nr:hypothetical protein [Acidimicrobiales bacterium]